MVVAGNLSRIEAEERGRLLQVLSYAVELDLTGDATSFGTTTVVRFGCTRPGATTFVDLAVPGLRRAVLNGVPLPATAYDADRGRITLPDLPADNELRIEAVGAYSRTGEGLHRFTDPVDDGVYLYTQLAPADAHRVFACFDQPDLKAPVTLTVLAPAGWQVAGNTAGTASPAGGDTARWEFPPTPPLPTYAVAVVAGDYHVVADEYPSIPLRLWCRRSLAGSLDAAELFAITKAGFGFFRDAFEVPYPFGKYDQVFVPDFNLGAMENAGCVTVHEKYVFRSRVTGLMYERRAETLLHEMAHMWFGDLVTMAWWDDLWLNESFATFAGVLALVEATRWTDGWTTFANLRKAEAYRQDQLPSTHPVAADIADIRAIEVSFDAITYLKGASVLKQLVAYVGQEEFLAGVRTYFRAHAWGNTTLPDLLQALEKSSGRDLRPWAEQWLENPGVNVLRPVATVDAAGRYTAFAVRQERGPRCPVLRSHRLAIGLYRLGPGGLVRTDRLELDVAGELTEITELTGAEQPDLLLINDDDLTYAKIRFDDRSLATVLTRITELTDPLARALCWAALWDLVRDGELPADRFAYTVAAALPVLIDGTLLQTLLDQARTALHRFVAPARRAELLARLAEATAAELTAAEPGSDRQLVLAQQFAATAVTGAQLDLLEDLRAGVRVPQGLVLDPDLRWALLRRLVVHGRAGDPEIDAELACEPTAVTARSAATCRAARPTPQAKAAAWYALTGGELTNLELRAVLEGFAEPEHAALLEPYAAQYFQQIDRVWREWSSGMAQRFVTGAYPAWSVTPDTIARTDAHLARPDVPAAQARLLREARDEIVRARRLLDLEDWTETPR
nr:MULTISPECIES: aminopeptidase N [unclassified Actinoplanes]